MNNICHDIFRAIHEGKWLKIEYRNRKTFAGDGCRLDEEQFRTLVRHFGNKNSEISGKRRKDGRLSFQQLAMNVLSIHTARGLYVQACRRLLLDVKQRLLRPEEEITVCTECRYVDTK